MLLTRLAVYSCRSQSQCRSVVEVRHAMRASYYHSRITHNVQPTAIKATVRMQLNKQSPLRINKIEIRSFSSLGNPMFPQPARPDFDEIDKVRKPKGGSGDKHTIDYLADHGGKIGIASLLLIVGLIYSYYTGSQDGQKIEKRVEQGVNLEPFEMQELRYMNMMDKHTYIDIVQQAQQYFSPGGDIQSCRVTYREFLAFLKNVKVSVTALKGSASNPSKRTVELPLVLKSMHLLDRLVMGIVMQKGIESSDSSEHKPDTVNMSDSSSNDYANNVHESGCSWVDVPLELALLLVVFNLLMLPEAGTRFEALHQLAATLDEKSKNSNAEEILVNNNVTSNEDITTKSQIDATTTVSETAVCEIIRHLITSDQIPTSKQIIETGVKWPYKLHRRKNETDMVDAYKAMRKRKAEGGGGWFGFLNPSNDSDKDGKNKNQQVYDVSTFSHLMQSHQVCAWGECYRGRD